MTALAALLAGALGAALVLAVLRPQLRRWRWRRHLAAAEAAVLGARRDGRLKPDTAEALLQHLEGLRHACAGRDEG